MWNKKTLLLLIVAVFGVLALMSPALAKKYEGGDEGDGDGVDAQGYKGPICTADDDECELEDPGYICGLEKGANINGDGYACLFNDHKQAKISLLSYETVDSDTDPNDSQLTKLCYKVKLNNLNSGKLYFNFSDNGIVQDAKLKPWYKGQTIKGHQSVDSKWYFKLSTCSPYSWWKACFTLDDRYRLKCREATVSANHIEQSNSTIVGPVIENCGEVDCVEVIEQTDLTPAYLKYNGKKVAKVELYSSTNNQEWTYKVKTEKKNAEVRSIKICGFGDIVDPSNDNLGCSTKGNFKTNCKLGTVELDDGCVKFNAADNKKIPDEFYIHIQTNEPYNVGSVEGNNLCEVSGKAKIPVKHKPKPPKDCPQQCPCCPCFPCFPYFGMGGCYGGCGGSQHGGCGGGNHGGCGGSHGGYEGGCGGDHGGEYHVTGGYDVQGSYESGKTKRKLVDIESNEGVSCPNQELLCAEEGSIYTAVTE